MKITDSSRNAFKDYKQPRDVTKPSESKAHALARKRAYEQWMTNLALIDKTRLLATSDMKSLSNEAKKDLFLLMFREMWPYKAQAVKASGLTFHWLRKQLKADPEFFEEVMSIEFSFADKLKDCSYKAAFVPANVQERVFWLRKILSDDFGDEPASIKIQNVVQNQTGEEGFEAVETLIKRRQRLIDSEDGDPDASDTNTEV